MSATPSSSTATLASTALSCGLTSNSNDDSTRPAASAATVPMPQGQRPSWTPLAHAGSRESAYVAERIPRAKDAPRKDGVDDTDRRRVGPIAAAEQAPLHEAHAHRGEIRRAHDVSVGFRHVGADARASSS